MNNLLFAIDIKAVLEDNTEIEIAKAFIINNKRVYKTSNDIVLTGSKKIKNIISSTITVPPEILNCIAMFEVQE